MSIRPANLGLLSRSLLLTTIFWWTASPLLAQEEAAAKSNGTSASVASWGESRLADLGDYLLATLPRILALVIVLLVILWIMRRLRRRLVDFLARSGRGTVEERESRARTLVSVFENAATTALYVGGSLMALDILRVPISTLLGGVAVVGLAVAFGTQNLIKDYFSGFMILLENQYKINDVVTILGQTGTVERITMRITVLRDFEGKVYFVPNGQITTVINQTHEWSRVIIDVPVATHENLPQAITAIHEVAEGVRNDAALAGAVLREPEVLGLERLSGSEMIVRVCLVTTPGEKERVRRLALERLKSRFDELGIAPLAAPRDASA